MNLVQVLQGEGGTVQELLPEHRLAHQHASPTATS